MKLLLTILTLYISGYLIINEVNHSSKITTGASIQKEKNSETLEEKLTKQIIRLRQDLYKNELTHKQLLQELNTTQEQLNKILKINAGV